MADNGVNAFVCDPFPNGSRWDSRSLRTQEEVDQMDWNVAQELGLSSTPGFPSALVSNVNLGSPPRFNSQLSTFQDPFNALTIILHRLSNHIPTSDIEGLMAQFAQHIPESLFMAILALDCPTVRAAWRGLLT